MSLFLSLSFSFFCLRLCFSFRRCPRICLCLCLSLCPRPCFFQCLCFCLSLTCSSRSSLVSLCQSLSLSLSCFLSHLLLAILLGQPHRLLRTIRALVEDLHLLQDRRLATFTFSTLDWMVGQHWDRIVCIGMFYLITPK